MYKIYYAYHHIYTEDLEECYQMGDNTTNTT